MKLLLVLITLLPISLLSTLGIAQAEIEYQVDCTDSSFSVTVPSDPYRNSFYNTKLFKEDYAIVAKPGHHTLLHTVTKAQLDCLPIRKNVFPATDTIAGMRKFKNSIFKVSIKLADSLKTYEELRVNDYNDFTNGKYVYSTKFNLDEWKHIANQKTFQDIAKFHQLSFNSQTSEEVSIENTYSIESELQHYTILSWTEKAELNVHVADVRVILKRYDGLLITDTVYHIITRIVHKNFENGYLHRYLQSGFRQEFQTDWRHGALYEALIVELSKDQTVEHSLQEIQQYNEKRNPQAAFNQPDLALFNARAIEFYTFKSIRNRRAKNPIVAKYNDAILFVHDKARITTGFFVSSDGYALVDISNTKSDNDTLIITNAIGDTLKYEMISRDNFYQIGLIKSNYTCLNYFSISDRPVEEITKVNMISAPLTYEFSNIISNGIIGSQKRLFHNTYYQADIKYCLSGIGGPVFTKNGEVVGIMRGKFVGTEVEALTLVAPSYLILNNLRITIQ